VIRSKATALIEFNHSLHKILPLIDLSSAKSSSRVAHLVSKCRHLIFHEIKIALFRLHLDRSATVRAPVDEKGHIIEVPRIPIHINRLLAAVAARPGDSIFEQALRQFDIHHVMPRRLRTPFTPPSGVKPMVPIDIHLKGEKVVGLDGPYRAFFSDICRELQNEHSEYTVVERDASEDTKVEESPRDESAPIAERHVGFTPDLFVRCPNGVVGVGVNREQFLLRPSRQSEQHIAMYRFLGILFGIALRSSVLLSLDLSSLVWKGLVDEVTTEKDLEACDKNLFHLIEEITSLSSAEEFDLKFSDTPLFFKVMLSDGSQIDLKPHGSKIRVTFANRLEYVRLVTWTRLHEADLQLRAIKSGLSDIVPTALLSLFTAQEMSELLCGQATVDIELLKRHTEYGGGLAADSPLIKNFWKVLEEFSDELRLKFLEFVYAQKRLPSEDEFKRQRLRMLIHPLDVDKHQNPDGTFPHSDTCFFNLKLPRYSSIGALRTNLTLAISSDSGFGLDEEERQLRSIQQSR